MPRRHLAPPGAPSLVALVVACLVASGCATFESGADPAPEAPPVDSGTSAHRIIDGDSLELDVDGEIVEVRMIGINAPEGADCQGPAAADALAEVIEGQPLAVESFGFDRFDRELVELFVDGESVNAAMVRAGWALGLHGDERDWTDEMKSAADDGLGMWDAPDLCPVPTDELRISDIEPDPPGPDDEVLEDEWIEIENVGAETADLTGWTVRDESTSNRLVLEGGALEPGQRLRIRTGCGEARAGELFWCSGNGVWSNRGETALLLAPSGAIVDVVFLD